MSTMTATAQDRVGRARAALRRAEELTGTAAFPAPDTPIAARPVVVPPVADTTVAVVPTPGRSGRLTVRAEPLPVAPGLAGLLPDGVLERGRVHVIAGSTSLTLALLAEASRTGAWLAVVGMEGIGLLAAEQLGLDLTRVALVPAPGPDAPVVVAALLDGMDMVLVGPRAVLDDADRRRLAARARERGVVLLSTEDWPGAHLRLTAVRSPWAGLGRGHGRLRSRSLTVRRTGRGRAAAGEVLRVELPAAGATPGVTAGGDGGTVVGGTPAPGAPMDRRAG